uniref:Uncharacterized protein n=1 Tax=Arundo donax TaxID=35708 RepID=A0A0A8ZF14_ARUDO
MKQMSNTVGNVFLFLIPVYIIGKTACPLKQNAYKLMAVGIPDQFTSTPFS